MKNILLLIILLCTSQWCLAIQQQVNEGDPEGFLVDQSYSTLAKDFFAGFSQVWSNEYSDAKQSVTVQERLSAANGSSVFIRHKTDVIYKVSLNRRIDNIESGRAAAKEVIQYLKTLGMNRSNSEDVADDEF